MARYSSRTLKKPSASAPKKKAKWPFTTQQHKPHKNKLNMIKRLIFAGACPASCPRPTVRQQSFPPATTAVAAAPADATAKKADPDINQRMADVEAYISNSARGSDVADAKVSSKLDGVAGPGHNAWM